MHFPGFLRRMRRQPIIIIVLLLNILVFSLYYALLNYESFTSQIMITNTKVKVNHVKAEKDKDYALTRNTKIPSMSSLLDKLAYLKDDSIVDMTNTLYRKLFNSDLPNSNWRFTNYFVNHKISLDIASIFSYVNKRKTQHLYDPRISMTVYLNYLNDIYETRETNEMPFSWEDWVDLSYLNSFLHTNGNKNCYEFLHNFDIDVEKFGLEKSAPSTDYEKSTYCLDNDDFMKTEFARYKTERLLPGFNFRKQLSTKSNFVGQLFNAKSYLLSYAPPPVLIYFLHDNGTYHTVRPYPAKSMMENGMFDTFVRKPTFQGFNPDEELENLNKKYLLHSQSDFKTQMINANSFELSIPESHFVLNPKELFHYLYAKKEENLEPNELAFLEGIKYSEDTKVENVEKHFTEVNVQWNTQFHGHTIRENGAHYDFRFFSGFLSEMPENEETTPHSPNYDPTIGKQYPRVDNEINRQTIILSHLVHTLFTFTFHEGIFMWPAHGSLLAWYFNSLSFPYDEDEDVQMPISDLAEFCLRYNNSMIVENPKYGMGKYYVDCSSSLTHRIKGLGNNNIDARVIDVDSGMYVDITGLSVSTDPLNRENLYKFKGWISDKQLEDYPLEKREEEEQEYLEFVLATREADEENKSDEDKKKEEENKSDEDKKKEEKNKSDEDKKKEEEERRKKEEEEKKQKEEEERRMKEEEEKRKPTPEQIYQAHKDYKIYNCRNDHYYTLDQLSPARLTLYEGAPTFVVASNRSLIEVLDTEYGKRSHANGEYKNWYYLDVLKMWVKSADMYDACRDANKTANMTNIRFDSVQSCYSNNKTAVLSELVKNSVYDITLQSSLQNTKLSRPRFNVLGELFRDNNLTSAHMREMRHFHGSYEWDVPMEDQSGIPDAWEGVAKWMLEDHLPPRLSMLDYLIFTEKEDQGKEIHVL